MIKMKLSESLRNILYWSIDAIKGNPIRHQLADVEFLMSSNDNSARTEIINGYLDSILQYATNHVPYYRSYIGKKKLEDFPVVNKNIIRNNEAQFLGDEFDKASLAIRETSGSTGMPFTVYQDARKRQRATADTLWFSKQAHYELGSRLYFSRVWDKKTTRSQWQCLGQNWVLHDASSLSDESIASFLSQLENDTSTKSILIFASSLTAIAKYLERNNISPKANVESFIAVSEALLPWTKHTIEVKFGAPVFSRYSDEELGIMAQQMENSDEFLVNTASFFIELLSMDKDEPVADGEEGRIVVTDLFNHAMPLIRYDTGDIAVRKSRSERFILEKVGGRRVDYIFDTRGAMVSPYVINTPMHEYLEIQQYQFIQEGETNYKMLINLKDGQSFGRESKMLMMLRSYLGNDAVIHVEYVDEIPVLKSGKRKQVVNNFRLA